MIDPAADTVDGSNHDIYALNTGLAALEGARGLGICPIDSPLVSLGRPGGYRYTKTYSQPEPAVYVNLFNNLFGVNFAQWIGGTWTSRIRVWPIQQYDAAASVVTPSLEARVPLEAAVFDGPAGTLPNQRAGVRLSRGGVLVTSFGPNPDGAGTLLRLWDQSGHDEGVQVTLPEGIRPKSVQPCNLRGAPRGAPIAVTEGRFTVGLRANAPASFLIPD
ncbi:MAG: hypothetical protein HY821_10960 [Acidobacteria bacterium]|nr:hypothetical protein [Acidobacteriota bacterium]